MNRIHASAECQNPAVIFMPKKYDNRMIMMALKTFSIIARGTLAKANKNLDLIEFAVMPPMNTLNVRSPMIDLMPLQALITSKDMLGMIMTFPSRNIGTCRVLTIASEISETHICKGEVMCIYN